LLKWRGNSKDFCFEEKKVEKFMTKDEKFVLWDNWARGCEFF
jgi:hypothetical protein